MRKILVANTMGTLLAASVVAPGTSSLPRTGASGTGTTVRMALVAIGMGLVLVVGARRRRRVRA